MVELYKFKLSDPEGLKSRGIEHFDAWRNLRRSGRNDGNLPHPCVLAAKESLCTIHQFA